MEAKTNQQAKTHGSGGEKRAHPAESVKSLSLGSDPTQEESQEREVCPDCGGRIISNGERFCSECGLVIDETVVDRGKEWREYDAGDRGNAPRGVSAVDHTRHDSGLGTAGYTPIKRWDIDERRREKLSNWGQQKMESQQFLLIDIKRAGSSLEIPDSVIDNACVLFKRFHESGHQRGHNLDHMAAASLYAACRVANVGEVHTDVMEQFDMETKETKLFDELRRLQSLLDVTLPLGDPRMYVTKFVNELDGDMCVVRRANKMAKEIGDSIGAFSGSAPSVIAATVVYEAFNTAQRDCSQTDIGAIADVTPRAIQHHRDEVREVIPDDLLASTPK